jgi:hypothetical protein
MVVWVSVCASSGVGSRLLCFGVRHSGNGVHEGFTSLMNTLFTDVHSTKRVRSAPLHSRHERLISVSAGGEAVRADPPSEGVRLAARRARRESIERTFGSGLSAVCPRAASPAQIRSLSSVGASLSRAEPPPTTRPLHPTTPEAPPDRLTAQAAVQGTPMT